MLRPTFMFLAFSAVCFAQCSQDTVRGTWAGYALRTVMVTASGSSTPVPVPVAELFIQTVDYQGRYTGKEYASYGGQMITGTFSGTIQVNADCVANDTFIMNQEGVGPIPGTASQRLFISDNGTQMRGMATKGLVGDPVGIGYYYRVAWGDPQCTTDLFHGVYGVTWEGTFLLPAAGQSQPVAYPFSQIGVGAFDYGAKGNGSATMSMGGNIIPGTIADANVSINSDCTGTVQYKGGAYRLILLNGGDEALRPAYPKCRRQPHHDRQVQAHLCHPHPPEVVIRPGADVAQARRGLQPEW